MRPGLLAALGLVALGLFFVAGAGNAEEGLRRTHRGGGVTIDVTPLPAKGGSQDLRFSVRMDTHSVALDDYDMVKASLLRNGRGRAVRAGAWADPTGGGHHREGVLVFPLKEKEGTSVLTEGAQFIEVVIRDVAGVPERVFRWNLPLNTNAR
ncbi:MAG: hypothetical protein HYY21_01080 [Candidatus Tectomicrobia bacterium]|nr:hypothetical protein [Candidatus Tectomicrobia bacterium]